MTKQTKFILAIAIQLIIIFAIIIFKSSVVVGGTEVLLQIEPVDPTDPFRGDYITFQYSDISDISLLLDDSPSINRGSTFYVVLERTGKYWEAVDIYKNKPEKDVLGYNKIFLKGRLDYDGRVVYGIEEYFIPEGTGRDFNFRSREAHAKVSVDKNGNAVLKQIYMDDVPWPQEHYEEQIKEGNSNRLISPQIRARDARRVSDLRSLRIGFEIYYDGHSSYPSDLEVFLESGTTGISRDLLTNNSYDYCVSEDGQDYTIGAQLEDKSSMFMERSAPQSQVSCFPNPNKVCGSDGYYCLNSEF
ncbi:MAG: GDYXXLXY domain-containing protein [Patescibacteria group bacterium]